MIVKLVGKQERKGVSKKTGNPYHLVIGYITCREEGVVGNAAKDILLDPETSPIESLQVQHDYNLEYGPYGRIVSFKLLK